MKHAGLNRASRRRQPSRRAIRSGWSLRTADPPLTRAQVAFGIGAALFACVVGGDARSAQRDAVPGSLLAGRRPVELPRKRGETVSRADLALCRAKAAGRDRVELAIVDGEAQRATIE